MILIEKHTVRKMKNSDYKVKLIYDFMTKRARKQ